MTQIERYLEFLEHARQFSKNTLKAVRYDLEMFDGDLENAIRADIEMFVIKENKRGMASATVNRRVSTLRGFFDWAIDNGLRLGRNPASGKLTPRVKNVHHEAISKEELDYLYDNANNEVKYIIGLMGYAGLRISEVQALDNYFYDDNGVLAAHLKNTKGGKERYVSLALCPEPELIIRIIDQGGLHGERGKLSTNALWRRVSAYTNVKPHAFRSTFATLLVEKNVNVATVRDLMGHTTLDGQKSDVTSRYVKTVSVEKQAQELKEAFGV